MDLFSRKQVLAYSTSLDFREWQTFSIFGWTLYFWLLNVFLTCTASVVEIKGSVNMISIPQSNSGIVIFQN